MAEEPRLTNIRVQILMDGEEADRTDSWDIYPEREAILIGTQDMLLSRALNRGYALKRNRWPMHFGLLNNDCLWIMDEAQLMGPGLWTSGLDAAGTVWHHVSLLHLVDERDEQRWLPRHA